MKKLVLLLAFLFAVASCEEDVRFNNPSVQALKNNTLWRAIDWKATIATDGSLLIEAFKENEVLSLRTTGTNKNINYQLGAGESQNATYVVKEKLKTIIYKTDGSTANGQVIVTDYDQASNTITGTFKFSAINIENTASDNPTISFQQGNFYKIPVTINIP